jgi:hypothetical protein
MQLAVSQQSMSTTLVAQQPKQSLRLGEAAWGANRGTRSR